MKFIFTFLLLNLSTLLLAQEKLVVNYQFNYAYDTSVSKDPKQLAIYKASNQNTGEYILITSKDEATFKKIEKLNNTQSISDVESIPVPNSNNYIDLKDHYSLDQMDFNGKLFLIKDSMKTYQWVIQRDKDQFLGYEVRKAIAKRDNVTYEAWYAPNLPFKAGPNNIFGLPGVILKLTIILDQDDGVHQHIYTAIKVELNDKAKIIKPTKGELMMVDDFVVYFNEIFRIEAELENNKVDRKID